MPLRYKSRYRTCTIIPSALANGIQKYKFFLKRNKFRGIIIDDLQRMEIKNPKLFWYNKNNVYICTTKNEGYLLLAR